MDAYNQRTNHSFLVVLDEPERSAKRELIERNRFFKALRVVQQKVRRWELDPSMVSAEETSRIDTLCRRMAKAYCREMDDPMELYETVDFRLMDATEQFNALLRQILTRTYAFVSEAPLFEKVQEKEARFHQFFFSFLQLTNDDQEVLLVRNRAWFEIQLLRLIHRIDAENTPELLESGILFIHYSLLK